MNKTIYRSIVFLLMIVSLSVSIGTGPVLAQNKPLTLAEIMTGLQSTSGGFSKAELNAFIKKSVLERGVTFKLTDTIQNELKQVGADNDLLRAIAVKSRLNSPPAVSETAVPKAAAEKIWIDQDATENGLTGVLVHAKFNVYNLKGVTTELYLRFKNRAGQYLISSNKQYSNRRGELAIYRKELIPAYTSTVFNDVTVFLPYNEINLPDGDHDLTLDANLLFDTEGTPKIVPVGDLPFKLNKPAALATAPGARFDSLTVDYKSVVNGVAGMTIHTKFSTVNMKDVTAQLAVGFFLENGERMMAKADSPNKSQSGQLTLYKLIKPAYPSTVFNDLSVFLPFNEFDLGPGQYTLKLHADLMYPNGTLIQHFDEKAFRFTK